LFKLTEEIVTSMCCATPWGCLEVMRVKI
jgi:hypothetical protein